VAQVFVADLDAPALDPADSHHLGRVLRLKPGEAVIASDGRGSWRLARYTQSEPWIEATDEVRFVPEHPQAVTIGFVPVKGDRPEWVVQKLTEIGVARMVVLRSSRSVVRWDGHRGEAAVDRLQKVASQAAAQSRRVWVPTVTGVSSVEEFAQVEPIILAERGGGSIGLAAPVCVGPEGGWTESELALASGTVNLGDGILRSETAAVVAGVLSCALRDRGFSH
jgi:16S rRNA (uracil1498-N3)-methyltransferase